MASGDLKSDDCIVITAVSEAATLKGDVCHLETASGVWSPITTGDAGPFGVALEAGPLGTETLRYCIWGPVEVTATAAAIPKGDHVIAGTTGFVKKEATIAETTVILSIVGTAMTAFDSSGQGTVWVGLV